MVQRLNDFAVGVYTEPATPFAQTPVAGVSSITVAGSPRDAPTKPRIIRVNFDSDRAQARPVDVTLVFVTTGTVEAADQTLSNILSLSAGGAPTFVVPNREPNSPTGGVNTAGSFLDCPFTALAPGTTYDVAVIGNYSA